MSQSLNQMLSAVRDFFDVPAVHDFMSILPTVRDGSIHWPDVIFAEPWILWGLCAVPVVAALYWVKRQPAVGHTRLPKSRLGFRGALTVTLMTTMALSLTVGTAALIAARAHPQKIEITPGDIAMVRDIHVAIDNSDGNMSEQITSAAHLTKDGSQPEPPKVGCGQQEDWGPRKIDAAVYSACKITEAFPTDRKSLATFDGATQCCAPGLNRDPRYFNQRLRYVNKRFGDNQTNYEDRNGVFQIMLDYMTEKSTSASRVLLLITDGDGTLTDESIAKYVRRIRSMHVTLICAGPGPDTVATDPDSDAIVKLCKQSGGIIVNVATPEGIQQAIDKIKALPPTEVKLPSIDNLKPIHNAFLFLAALAWGLTALMWAALGRVR